MVLSPFLLFFSLSLFFSLRTLTSRSSLPFASFSLVFGTPLHRIHFPYHLFPCHLCRCRYWFLFAKSEDAIVEQPNQFVRGTPRIQMCMNLHAEFTSCSRAMTFDAMSVSSSWSTNHDAKLFISSSFFPALHAAVFHSVFFQVFLRI